MLVYRLTREKYSNTLTASGAANRWNKKGQFVLYTGATRALVTLEQLAHLSGVIPIQNFKMMVIEIQNVENIGADWYEQKKKLLLKVPSVIIPKESNYVINTTHPDYLKNCKILEIEEYFWDNRLF